jgi:hypothetical protein
MVFCNCTAETFLNQTASRGGDIAGASGNIEVIFINNTPHRAVFTYGTYNNTDQFAVPTTRQFVAQAGRATLEGDALADIETLPCDRAFSIGDSELLRLIRENLDEAVLETLDPQALVEGVAFSSAPLGDENAAVATEGFSRPLRALLGVDFPCGAILVIRFEIADVGPAPFQTVFEIIPSRDDGRGL